MDEVEDVLGGRRLRAIRQPVPIVPPTDPTTQPEEPGTLDLETSTGRLRTKFGPRAIRRRRRLALAATGVLAAGIGGAAGLLTRDEGTTARAQSQSLAIDLPSGWRADTQPGRLPGLSLNDTVGASKGRETIVAGVARGPDPGLLPRSFRLGLTAGPGAATELVRLGGLEGIRNTDMTLGATREPLALYAVPTSLGVLVIVCRAPRGKVIGVDCERAAASLDLRRGEPRPLTPSVAYGTQVDGVMGDLQPRRRNMRQRLANATTRDQQQQASAGANDAYNRAFVRLRVIKPPAVAAQAHAQLVKATKDTAAAYRVMEKAAVNFDRDGFERGRQRVRRGETQIQGAFDGLRQAGYSIV
jgi:hypothetical protein